MPPGIGRGRNTAPGDRRYNTGTVYYVGLRGYNWSSSTPLGSSGACRLYFDYGAVSPNGGNGRAYGFQLRCLQE
ncbi:MAG: hypothetical protein K2K83_01660 [Rikenella sp.]|nr:hypothetical protein [Rikenella sp.]